MHMAYGPSSRPSPHLITWPACLPILKCHQETHEGPVFHIL